MAIVGIAAYDLNEALDSLIFLNDVPLGISALEGHFILNAVAFGAHSLHSGEKFVRDFKIGNVLKDCLAEFGKGSFVPHAVQLNLLAQTSGGVLEI